VIEERRAVPTLLARADEVTGTTPPKKVRCDAYYSVCRHDPLRARELDCGAVDEGGVT
jgi:hypothetical protein